MAAPSRWGLHERPEDRDEPPLHAGGVGGTERGVHHTRVQSVGRDAGGPQPPGQLVGEQDIGELGLVVGPGAGVGPLALEVVEVDASLRVCVGGDRDHAGGGALLQPLDEQAGEQERGQVVHGEGVLETVDGDPPGVPVAPDVVDQHVDPRQSVSDLVSQAPYLGLGGQIRDEGQHLAAVGAPDVPRGGVGARGVAAGDGDACAHRGQSEGGRLADAAGAAGDEDGAAGHGVLHYEARAYVARVSARAWSMGVA